MIREDVIDYVERTIKGGVESNCSSKSVKLLLLNYAEYLKYYTATDEDVIDLLNHFAKYTKELMTIQREIGDISFQDNGVKLSLNKSNIH